MPVVDEIESLEYRTVNVAEEGQNSRNRDRRVETLVSRRDARRMDGSRYFLKRDVGGLGEPQVLALLALLLT